MRKNDLTGQQFGKLKVVALSNKKMHGNFLWECLCKCGNTTYSLTQNLTRGKKKSCGCNKADLVGFRTGQLTVLSCVGIRKYDDTHAERRWLCRCDCGKETELSTAVLTKHKVKTCGCAHSWNKDKHHGWKGHGEISGTMWKQINSCGSTRSLEFTITIEYIWDLYLEQNRKCNLSGEEIFFDTSFGNSSTASLDRIDSTKGYVEGNVQWLHKDVNKMKSDLSQDRFVSLCKAIACASCEG